PAAEWIEHVSDLAFHYLDLLDALELERAHLVGASFGGWIAAEIATMASHRLASLVLIDPVGIRVDGWIYPFLFAMDIPEIVTTPTLVCWGAHDRLAPLAPCGETWAREIPGARLRVFADSGHVPHLEEPDAVATAVREFCRLHGGLR